MVDRSRSVGDPRLWRFSRTQGFVTNSNLKCSVLIVEDDRITREALTMLLANAGHPNCAAGSVAECFEKLDGQACAVLDLNLPDGLGTEVIQRMRGQRRLIRIVVVSGTSDLQLLEDAHTMGADLVMRKPLNVKRLLSWLGESTPN